MEKPHIPQAKLDFSEAERRDFIGSHGFDRFTGHEKQVFSADTEIRNYITSLDGDVRAHIASVHSTLSKQPISPDVTSHVIIPIAAGQEVITLSHTLEQYATQNADPASWELLLFVNEVVETEDENVGEKSLATLGIIDNFRRTNPQINIRALQHTYYGEPPAIGSIRADAWDVLLFDLSRQEHAIPDDSIGISNDADTKELPLSYIATMQSTASLHKEVDILTCRLDWYKEGSDRSDANQIIRYWEYLRNERQRSVGRFSIPDANSAIRLGTYAALGGFNRNAQIREMIELHQRLVCARREPDEQTKYVRFVPDIYLATDSRRIYRTINNGLSPHHTWDLLPFLTGADPVRDAANTQTDGSIDPLIVFDIFEQLDKVYLSRLSDHEANKLRTLGRQAYGSAFADLLQK